MSKKESLWVKISHGLSKTSTRLSSGLRSIFGVGRKIDEAVLEEFEELMLSMDFGPKVAMQLVSKIREMRLENDMVDEFAVKGQLVQEITRILEPVERKLGIIQGLQVIMVCGVNGNGKTTTVAKLANRYQSEGAKVILAACDTFRAAAVEQLVCWSERLKCEIVTGQSDASSVAYNAVEVAKRNGADVLIIDTAGRLHNQNNLMDELAKIKRAIKKHGDNYPQEVLLVLDATVGQNAFNQVDVFSKVVDVTGLIITKLDGSAKGGVVIGLAQRYGIPICSIGIGEQIDDLKDFDAKLFANGVFTISE